MLPYGSNAPDQLHSSRTSTILPMGWSCLRRCRASALAPPMHRRRADDAPRRLGL